MDHAHALDFILAGQATFTLESKKTGAYFSFRVVQRPGVDGWTVSLLTGPNNETDWKAVGNISSGGYLLPHASWDRDTPSHKAFAWVLCRLTQGLPTTLLEIHHAGTCGACGRPLTTPESCTRGLGPICWEKRESNAAV